MIWFTSDQHFFHKNISRLAGRPFDNVDDINDELIRRHNSVVSSGDLVFHLGDFSIGRTADALALIRQLNGTHMLVIGNHDRMFEGSDEKRSRWTSEYLNAGFVAVQPSLHLSISGADPLILSHFPAFGDSGLKDRYPEHRPVDDGSSVIVHGHVHSKSKIIAPRHVHVGVDAWDYTPAPLDEVIKLAQKSMGHK